MYYLFKRQSDRDEEREVFKMLVNSPNGHNNNNNQGWPRPKLGAGNSIIISHIGDRDSNTWIILLCLPRHISRE